MLHKVIFNSQLNGLYLSIGKSRLKCWHMPEQQKHDDGGSEDRQERD